MDAVALAMIEALPSTAPTVGWATVGALAAIRQGAAVSTDGTRFYASHGATTSAPSVTATMQVFDPFSGISVAGTAGSGARQGVAGAWCNGKHYAINGQTSGGTSVVNVESYTPAGTNGASGVWSQMAQTPVNVSYASAATIGNFIYVAGGSITSGTATATLQRYDSVNNTWSTLASMPAGRTQGAMTAVGTNLYYLGGLNNAGTATATCYVFDTTAGTWTSSTPLAVAYTSASAVSYGSSIYALAQNGTGLVLDTVAQTSTALSPTAPAHGASPGAVVIGRVIYLVSGASTANVDKLDLGAGTGFTTAVLGAKSLLNPLLAGVASILPGTPPTDTTGKASYAQTVQTLKALAAL